ncbi:GspE/PulE family protein [Pygmaiobacter massiliensis]|uniref:GspE/PulE family protein n=1 Tax=Pygmaiobacter massiliensis TaxID=1917873 RepID=UPI0028A00118|nr:ATPase, T2SS/T4P/T4SS family [Pygmaiobacter massiliensis]
MVAKKVMLGARLIQDGTITPDQLNDALEYQRRRIEENGRRIQLGTALVALGYCTDEDIANAMSRNTGYDLMSLNSTPLDMEAANLITPDVAQRYHAIPVGFDGERLLVAMRNPNDLIAVDDLRLITGREIRPVIVSDDELAAVIEQFANLSAAVETTPDELDEKIPSFIEETDTADKPAVILTSQIINSAVRTGASDIHVEPQEKTLRIRFRIDGVLHEMMTQPMSIFPAVASRLKVLANMDIAERRVPQDGRATLKVDDRVIDLRVASLPSAYGEKITMRLLDRSARNITIDELGFPPNDKNRYMETVSRPYGFLLVTGPTGSGKSTTLYATLAQLNTPEKNVITLEDPIERRMNGLNQVQMNERAGMTFASGLRSILRSDPDIVMIGEIRDRETAKIAVEAALTGHFVLSTLHTNDASSAVTRLGEMGVEPFLTASSLVGVIAQRLVRVLCPRCKKAVVIPKEKMLATVPDFPFEPDENSVTVYQATGCLACNNTGYKGRRGVYEFLQVDEEIRNLILEHASNHEIQRVAMAHGMVTLRGDGFQKVRGGITSMEEMLRVIV